MALIDDVVTYLEMTRRPARPPAPAPRGRSALMRVENCPVSFYRYLYGEVGEPWLWHERRRLDDAALAAILHRPTTELFVLYVGGAPAGYFELDRSVADVCELAYFGLAPSFIGRGWGRFLLDAAVDAAWAGEPRRVWVHTCTFDHPRAIGAYQKAGFMVYDRRPVRFEDPRRDGTLPTTLTHPRLPPLEEGTSP
jgi:ribosomal protein S18 acetylase RimI-like enzyme